MAQEINLATKELQLEIIEKLNLGFGFLVVNSWKGLQNLVREGQASKYFKVGDQIVSLYGTQPLIWDVIGIDHDTPTDTSYVHSLTIQTHDILADIQFDAPEPSNPDSNRQTNGNNRYIHSAIRQWLNSSQATFQWQSQHQYDTTPSTITPEAYGGAGFLDRLDPELVAVLGAVNKQVARNTVVDGGGQDTFSDKVFLLSPVEVGFSAEGETTGESVYPFYEGVANAGRIKKLGDTAKVWWLRSPFVSYSYYVRYVSADGMLGSNNANYAYGAAPACCII